MRLALLRCADAHRAVEHRGIGLTLMKDASTQWQLQHVRRKFGGVRHPHAWVPPGLHVVPPPHEDVQQKVTSFHASCGSPAHTRQLYA